ncbi:ATP-binding protein [uncultured Polaribacter sp.]|uniref:tetratricopeptide repeat-containing sensor histidine kinase n=1 Tax=uncultured Polaribacter sp. TaxID=174711 RepID=UPI0026277336|nr:ATP-binding protein [uncultured Polaribacter sp.]
MIKLIIYTLFLAVVNGKSIAKESDLNNKYCDNTAFKNLITALKTALAENNLKDAERYLSQSKNEIKNCRHNKVKYHSYKAYIFRLNKQYDSAFYQYNYILKFNTEKNIENYIFKSIAYKGLALISSEIDKIEGYHKNLKESLKYAYLSKDAVTIFTALNNLGVYHNKSTNFNKSIKYYRNALHYSNNQALLYQNIGAAHLLNKNSDSAFYYLNKSLQTAKDSTTLSLIYLNFAKIAKQKEQTKKNITLLLKSLSYAKTKETTSSENKLLIFKNLFSAYYTIKNYKLALKYLELYNNLKYKLQNENIINNINNLNIKYETEKKERENLQLKQKNLKTEAKRVQNRNFLVGSLLFIFFAGAIAVLSLKNSKRKRKLAEQEKALEIQKNLTLLKEQEISTINAMVEGQEKERKRVAEDLHDNLGSVLATLKLHFDNLKMNNKKKKFNQEELFNKTENLIDEAYLKVRRIAHAKNAGVIANHGLLPAVQMMAEKISAADKIRIEVIDFGLDARFDSSLEITIFRIIQELITNILKHANAKNATINIALYDKNLNIIVEDNGKGFNANQTNFKDGIGLNSIKTRVKHLKGNFTIDATIGKGSSFIIDIPVA